MAKIICISKYPPLEGGIAAKTFWLSKALAERGHTIHVITDREDISPKYSIPTLKKELIPPNIIVHRPQNEIPWHIPNIPDRTLELLNITLQVINEYKVDVIDTGYLIPYGIVGYLTSKITNIPFILRHGGSDIEKFLNNDIWEQLLERAFAESSITITDQKQLNKIQQLTSHIELLPPYVPNPSFFKPEPKTKKVKPILALIGKANYYWQHKGWHRIVEIIKFLGTQFEYLIISQGSGLENFKKYVGKNIDFSIEWKSFIHPIEMPYIYKSIDGVFVFEQDLPFSTYSNLIIEALYSGTIVITDKKDTIQNISSYGLHIDNNIHNLLIVPYNKAEVAAQNILHFFNKYKEKEDNLFLKKSNYESYILENEKLFL